jgi:hypothetical protein
MEIIENLKFNNKERLNMNLRKRIFVKLGMLISLLAVNVIAATPGSSCTIRGYFYYGIFIYRGTVSADGAFCIPEFPPQGPLAYLKDGVPCNRTIFGPPPITTVSSSCPN